MLQGMLKVQPVAICKMPLLRSSKTAGMELPALCGERVRLELLVKKAISFSTPVTVLVKGEVSVPPVFPIL